MIDQGAFQTEVILLSDKYLMNPTMPVLCYGWRSETWLRTRLSELRGDRIISPMCIEQRLRVNLERVSSMPPSMELLEVLSRSEMYWDFT